MNKIFAFWNNNKRSVSRDNVKLPGQSQLPDAYKEFLNLHNEYRRKYKEVDDNDRRLQKRLYKESSIKEKQLKRQQANEERKGWWWCCRWCHWLYKTEHFGPETYDIRPAVVQMNLYIFNALQGLITGLIVFYFNIMNTYNVPAACGLIGLYVMLCFPAGLDFFGSIFGMITSYHLEGTFGYRKTVRKKTYSIASSLKRMGKSLFPNEDPVRAEIKGEGDINPVKPKQPKWKYLLGFIGPCCFCNVVLSLCLKKGRSKTFVNCMGYLSWIFLQLAWFFNLAFVAYYHWRHIFSASYRDVVDQCKNGSPKPAYCADFDSVYRFLFVTMAVTFVIRNILVFFIGMCFKEAPLKRYPPNDPTVEIPSTCSDTDVDYNKVPEPLLRPYLRRQPWMLNWPVAGASKTGTKDDGKSKRKRVLSVREAQAEKTLQVFKDIRRAKPMLGKKRRDIKIRKVKGAPDTIQMPADLLTAKARAWLSEEDTATSQDDQEKKLDSHERHYQQHRLTMRPVTRRRVRKSKDHLKSSSESLTYVHDPDSKTKIPVARVVRQKLKNLSDRVSTDDSWSGNADSLFEDVPLSQTEQDPKKVDETKEKQMCDEYMALRMEMGDTDSNGSGESGHSRNQDQADAANNEDAMS